MMVADNFEKCLGFVLRSEGGYSNDAHDPGGATMNGIIQREYDAYLKSHGLSHQPVRYIHTAERDEIYKTEYWDALKCDQLSSGLDYCAFDAGVNSGISRGKRWLDQSRGSIDTFCDIRLAFLRSLSTWRYFGGGWGARVEFVRRNAKAMAGGKPIHDIAWVQTKLNLLGDRLSVDDLAGAKTIAAIKRFQALHSLAVDGCAGPQTIAALEAAVSSIPPIPPAVAVQKAA
jgi:lysozyme family protein